MEFLNNNYWRRGQPITKSERNLIVYFLGAGFEAQDIANASTRDKRTIDNWVERFRNTGELNEIKHRGQQRATTIDEDLQIALCAIENPRITRAEIRKVTA